MLLVLLSTKIEPHTSDDLALSGELGFARAKNRPNKAKYTWSFGSPQASEGSYQLITGTITGVVGFVTRELDNIVQLQIG